MGGHLSIMKYLYQVSKIRNIEFPWYRDITFYASFNTELYCLSRAVDQYVVCEEGDCELFYHGAVDNSDEIFILQWIRIG